MKRNLLIALLPAVACLAGSPSDRAAPLFFIENRGQAPADVRFMAQGSGLTAYLSPAEALFRVDNASVRVQFVGASLSVDLGGVDPLPGNANFLTGTQDEWRVGVPMYGAVEYRGLYPGIDMRYGSNGRNLKSEFVVAAGADPMQIRLRYLCGSEIRVDDAGALVIPLNGRELREQAPTIYQERDGARVPVSGQFTVNDDGVIGFAILGYDVTLPLVIDPVLSYGTLLGGSSSDAATALAVDSGGNAYIAGFTASYDFPTLNPEQSTDAGGNDVFVAKLNPAGNGLVYCTFIGGRGDDRAYGIAVDSTGAAYVTGWTTSTNFPLKNAMQASLKGSKDAFVLKLNTAGNSLLFSTYLGGNASDQGNGIAIDTSQNVYIVGDTTSTTFPASAMQTTNRGGQDAFVAKLAADGSHLIYSTYLGGSSDDHGAAIAVDATGSAYVAGSTYSVDFPLANAWQSANGGGQDAFVARMSVSGNSLVFGTYLGGSGGALGYPEAAQGIALDSAGNAYVAGVTPSSSFPLLHAAQATRNGSSVDAFAAKLTAAGSLSYSTYIGGTGVDSANAIAVDAGVNAYIVGQTFSTDLAVVNPYQASNGGDYDVFWAKLNSAGDTFLSLSYLGGSGADTATAVALDPAGNTYIAGWTLSTNFPVLNGYQAVNSGNYGAFVEKIVLGAPPAPVSVTPSSGTGASQVFSLQFSDFAGATDLNTVSVLFNASQSSVAACSVTYTRGANALTLLTDAGAASGVAITPGSGSLQNSQCTVNGAGSSVTVSGNVLTLNLSLSFQSSFSGAKNVYLQASSPYGVSPWQQLGAWTVPSGPPAPVSVTPSSGSGSAQTFSFVFSDAKGYSAITFVSVLINSSLTGVGGCYMLYYPANKMAFLANDAVSVWTGPATMGQAGTLQNSQCTLNLGASSSSGSGATLTVNLALSFQPAFGGANKVYMRVSDGLDSGLQQMGVWTVPAASPVPVSVTPSSGTGASQTFSMVYSDPKTYSSIVYVSALINGSPTGPGGCYILYYPAANYVYLANDAVSVWTGPASIGQTGTLQNSHCSLNVATSSSSGSGTNLTLNLALTFTTAFGGSKNIYMQVYDGVDSGLQQLGTWTVPASPPAPVSVTPSSGSGMSQTFSLVFTDPKGYAALTYTSLLINSSLTGVGGCYFLYYPGLKYLYLANDAVSSWMGPVTLGQAGTLQNSQCTVNSGSSWDTGSGNNLTVNLALSFQAAFAGAKKIYMRANDGLDSGLQQLGTWTVQ